MTSTRLINIKIDKITKSIESAISGDNFKTEILPVSGKDLKQLKKADWLFDWKMEAKDQNKLVFKLVTIGNENTIQGLVSLQDKGDHIFMHLIESNKFNRGSKKIYLGVPANLVAYACRLSREYGYAGYVSFESKTKLINHYRATLGASLLFGNFMAIDASAANKLIDQYFPKNV